MRTRSKNSPVRRYKAQDKVLPSKVINDWSDFYTCLKCKKGTEIIYDGKCEKCNLL